MHHQCPQLSNIHLQFVKFGLYVAGLGLELFQVILAPVQLDIEHHIMGLYLSDAILQLIKFPLDGGPAPGQWVASSKGKNLCALRDDYIRKK